MRKLFFVLILMGALLLIFAGVFAFWLYPSRVRPLHEYRDAVALAEAGDYVPAALQFETMKDYADSAERAKRAWLSAGDASFDGGDLAQARTYYLKAGASSEVLSKVDSAYYQLGVKAYAENERVEAENCFSCISHGSSYIALLDPVRMSAAERFLESGDYDSAGKVFHLCGESSYEEIAGIWLECGKARLEASDLDSASYCFAKAMAYTGDEAAMKSGVNSLWNDAALAARRNGDEALAQKCLERRL
ncbi:MAG: hypothetical protein IKG85_09460 [Clostridia bacterium]|nr:hypothetical protein [Clostridia bacterium]